MNKIIKITGLDCANCARELEEELERIEGVSSVTVDFMGQRVIADCDESAVDRIVYACNHFEEVKVVEDLPTEKTEPTDGASGGKKIKIANLCCANCARELEEELNKIDGVSATVDFMNMCVLLNAASTEAYDRAIYAISHFEDVKIVDGKPERKSLLKQHLRAIISIAISAALFIPALILDLTKAVGAAEIARYVCYGGAFVAAGYPVLWNTVKNLSKGKIFDENFLMSIASVGAILLGIFTGDGFMEGVAVMLLYQIGELLQSVAVGSSRNSITELMNLKSETATLIKDGIYSVVSPEDLRAGDRILIKAGEKVPVDCKIVKGSTSLDMKSLNGEAIPKDAEEGDEILSGAINLSGVVEAETVREYKNSAVAKILELVENSTAKKAMPEKFITKFARYYTPVVVIAALLVAALVPTVICAVEGVFVWATYSNWIYKSLSFLVISCPCALVISVPLSYFGGIGRCAKSGILVKGSTCLDELAKATVAAFDKTGTLTEGSFEVVSYSDEKALLLAAAAEKYSSHPIAASFRGIDTPYAAENAEELAGLGVKCMVNGETLLCGNAKLLDKYGIEFPRESGASTLVYVALNGEYSGVVRIDDAVKQDAKSSVEQLKALGVNCAVMLTGDSPERARAVAEQTGMDDFKAGLLPDEKLDCAIKLKERGGLIYVGDGINDAPVMTAADCAVSMGKVGSDAAIEASDVVLVSDSLALLPEAKRIAKGTRAIVYENIIGSLAVKLAIMALGVAVPAFPLIAAIFGDVGVMLIAVLNAMRTNAIK